jgi:hypothetical protein
MSHLVEIERSDLSVTLVAEMRSRVWKKVALAFVVLFWLGLMGLFVANMREAEVPKFFFGMLIISGMLFFWPILPLLWNVFGKEWIEISTKAIRWTYDYGFFQMNGGPKNLNGIALAFKHQRTIGDERVGIVEICSRNAQDFPEFLRASAIPIPEPQAEQFINAVHALWPQVQLAADGFPPVGSN